MNQDTSSTLPPGPSAAPDFKQVRSYLKDIGERERLGEFIKAGWTPAELGEFARAYKRRNKTYPTATAYQIAVAGGPDSAIAQIYLKAFRSPSYVLPPFNRPDPPPAIHWDHPDHPDHPPAIKNDVLTLARCFRNYYADQHGDPRPADDKPLSPARWTHYFHLRARYNSLEEALERQGLSDYR